MWYKRPTKQISSKNAFIKVLSVKRNRVKPFKSFLSSVLVHHSPIFEKHHSAGKDINHSFFQEERKMMSKCAPFFSFLRLITNLYHPRLEVWCRTFMPVELYGDLFIICQAITDFSLPASSYICICWELMDLAGWKRIKFPLQRCRMSAVWFYVFIRSFTYILRC